MLDQSMFGMSGLEPLYSLWSRSRRDAKKRVLPAGMKYEGTTLRPVLPVTNDTKSGDTTTPVNLPVSVPVYDAMTPLLVVGS